MTATRRTATDYRAAVVEPATLATASGLVRPGPVRDTRPDHRSYEEILEDDLGQALDENDQLKASLQRMLAAYASAKGQIARQTAKLEQAALDTQQLKARIAELEPPPAPPPTPPRSSRFTAPIRFPLAVEERRGIAAAILEPLRLRSGAVLEPVSKAVLRNGRAVRVPDTSWLVLCALARGGWVERPALDEAIGLPNATRAAVHRVVLALAELGAASDLEIAGHTRDRRWRLVLGGQP